jgi:hypothetical protein
MPTIVDLGVTDAVERLKKPDGSVYFRPVEGERITTFMIPDGVGLSARIEVVLAGLTHTLDATKRPHWVDTEDVMLKTALEEHFGIPLNTPRPPQWGDGTTTAGGD